VLQQPPRHLRCWRLTPYRTAFRVHWRNCLAYINPRLSKASDQECSALVQLIGVKQLRVEDP